MDVENVEKEQAPVFKRWRGWYVLVIIVLVVQIIVYTLITNSFQ